MAKAKYTTGQVIDALTEARGVKAHAAKILGCTRVTVNNYIKRHPTVAQAYNDLRETMLDVAEDRLMRRLDAGDWPAVKFVLSTLGRGRGYVPGHDITTGGSKLAAIEFIEVVLHDDTNDDLGEGHPE